jgi:hypothetical protein
LVSTNCFIFGGDTYIAPFSQNDFSPAIRERRRTLQRRNLLVRQMVQMKNKIAVLLMEIWSELQQAEA